VLAQQTFSYKIRSYHTDARGNLFIQQLLNFFQDAAHQHADGLGFGQAQLSKIDLYWVLSRLSIKIKGLPVTGDKIALTTWVKSIRASMSEREFSVSSKGKLLVNASSLWFCISGENHKPRRVPAEYTTKMIVSDTSATTSGPLKIEKPDTEIGVISGKTISAQQSDIDMVAHVNNASYARWIFDELPRDYQENRLLKQLTINYLGEAFLDEKLAVSHWRSDNQGLAHKITREGSQETICLAESVWL